MTHEALEVHSTNVVPRSINSGAPFGSQNSQCPHSSSVTGRLDFRCLTHIQNNVLGRWPSGTSASRYPEAAPSTVSHRADAFTGFEHGVLH
jgi:hypothetical protein